jgi:hypothetical protein
MEKRFIGGRLYTRKTAPDRATGRGFWSHAEYTRVVTSASLRKNPFSGRDENSIEREDWQRNRTWDRGPGDTFQSILRAMKTAHALPRRLTEPELEAARLRQAGFALAAQQLEQVHPPAPPVMIQPEGSLFAVNEEEVLVGLQGHRLLVIGEDEIRTFLNRHVMGDGGELGNAATVDWDDDKVFCPPLAGPRYESEAAIKTGFGLVRSRYGAYRPSIDGPSDECAIDPRHAGTVHGRKRNVGDWFEVVTLLVPGQPTRTVVFTNKDQFMSQFGGS